MKSINEQVSYVCHWGLHETNALLLRSNEHLVQMYKLSLIDVLGAKKKHHDV